MSGETSPRPRVDFYILGSADAGSRLRFACRLTEKIWKLGHRVYIHAGDHQTANAMDSLLWTFKQDSFVPHAIADGRPEQEEPILIGRGEAPPGNSPVRDDPTHDVLLTLAPTAPVWFASFARVAELIPADQAGRAAGRTRYKFYRDEGCEVQTHEL